MNSSIITDTLLAAMFVAGRSCGPPDALSSSSLAAIRQKYINATCYYAGPIFRAVTNNNTAPESDLPCYNSTFESDIVLVRHSIRLRTLPKTCYFDTGVWMSRLPSIPSGVCMPYSTLTYLRRFIQVCQCVALSPSLHPRAYAWARHIRNRTRRRRMET